MQQQQEITQNMANNDNVVSVLLEHIARHLQSDTNNSTQEKNRGRTILMILYLCVLAMCFITPIIYYIRLRCEERRAHRLGQLEAEGMAVALEESQQQQRQETRAVWRKYVEERRARLKQLFRPVQLVRDFYCESVCSFGSKSEISHFDVFLCGIFAYLTLICAPDFERGTFCEREAGRGGEIR